MDETAASQEDLFANTQVESTNPHVSNDKPDEWADTNFDYPYLILFCWDGETNPFMLVPLTEIDPRDIDWKWLSGILSPKSRCKLRKMTQFPDYSVSIFGKVQRSKLNLLWYDFLFL